MIIAIDGPAGAGKSTVSKQLAARLGIPVLDTGALFRSMALFCIRNDVDMNNELSLRTALAHVSLEVEPGIMGQNTLLNGENVTAFIRTPEVSKGASKLGTSRFVRQILTEQVRGIASKSSYVVEGRDIGSAMLPNATIKFFLTASVEERARRRYNELIESGKTPALSSVQEEIILRDKQDESREIAPLIMAEDAVLIDSSDLKINEVVNKMLEVIGDLQK